MSARLPEGQMTTFDQREQGFERKFAHDAEQTFRITARRNRLAGLWAAGLLGLPEAEADAYAKAVVQADFEEAGDDDVVRKLLSDLLKGGVDVAESDVRATLDRCLTEARAQIEAGG
jgi:hypothetical protein